MQEAVYALCIMMRLTRFELVTLGFEDQCSIQLSYRRKKIIPLKKRDDERVSDGVRTRDPQGHNLVL